MWELDYKETWVLKNWCFWTMVLEKTLERPLDFMENKPINPKGDQTWIFIGRTDAEAETPILWPPDAKNYSLEKTLVLGKIEGGRRRGRPWVRWLDGIIDSMDMSLSKLQESLFVTDREAWHVAVHGLQEIQDSVPGSGRSSGECNGYPLQYSCLENPVERGAWWATAHWATKSCTWLSN